MRKEQKEKKKPSKTRESHQIVPNDVSLSLAMETATTASALPPAVRVRLYELFVQIEREFEMLYAENLSLQEKVERLSSAVSQQHLHQQLQQQDRLSQHQSEHDSVDHGG